MSHLKIPVSPKEFPQQSLYEVKAFPKWPAGCGVHFPDYSSEHNIPGVPESPSEESIPLAQVEWSWSPMHARVDAYQLHRGRDHWVLWCGGPGSNASTDISLWHPAAYMDANCIPQEDAAMFLLDAFWNFQLAAINLDRFHWINRVDALSVSHLQCIAKQIWPSDD